MLYTFLLYNITYISKKGLELINEDGLEINVDAQKGYAIAMTVVHLGLMGIGSGYLHNTLTARKSI
jgi:hypothetical protein